MRETSREPRRESHLVDAFFDLLEFFDGRATNREVLDLLDSIALRARFGLEDEDLNTFRGWIRDCHAHWGLDGDHRRHLVRRRHRSAAPRATAGRT